MGTGDSASGCFIRDIRARHQLSLRALAAKAGDISYAAVAAWEQGRSLPREALVSAVCRVLRLSTAVVMAQVKLETRVRQARALARAGMEVGPVAEVDPAFAAFRERLIALPDKKKTSGPPTQGAPSSVPGYPILEQQVVVLHPGGIHVRPAQRIADVSGRYLARIRIASQGLDSEADACAIIEVLNLAAPQGTILTLRAQGPDAEHALTELSSLDWDGGPLLRPVEASKSTGASKDVVPARPFEMAGAPPPGASPLDPSDRWLGTQSAEVARDLEKFIAENRDGILEYARGLAQRIGSPVPDELALLWFMTQQSPVLAIRQIQCQRDVISRETWIQRERLGRPLSTAEECRVAREWAERYTLPLRDHLWMIALALVRTYPARFVRFLRPAGTASSSSVSPAGGPLSPPIAPAGP